MATLQMAENLAPQSKGKNVTLWVLQVVAAAMFFMAGFSKLAGAAQMVSMFEAIGLGQGFRYFTGATEVISASLLLVPALSGIGALILVPVMIGAVATHAFIIGGNAIPAIFLLIVSAIVAYGRLDRTRKVLGR